MEVKKHEEFDNEAKRVADNENSADVSFTEVAPDGETRFTEISPDGKIDVVEIDKRTDTDAEKKKSAPKRALIVGGLALLMLVAAILMVKSSSSDPVKKNITVAAGKSKTAAVPGFNPEYASKNLMASTDVPNTNTMPAGTQQQQIPANIPPGLKGNIPPYAPPSQSPIFGSTIQTIPATTGGGTQNFMDVPVTQQGSAGAQPLTSNAQKNPSAGTPNGTASNYNSGSGNTAGKATGSGGGGSRSGRSGYLSNGGSLSNQAGGASSLPESEQMASSSSAPASQSSYFLYAKAAGGGVSNNSSRGADNADYTASDTGQNNKESPMVVVRAGDNARPPFGTMLPLQTLGAIDTLGQTQLVRMVLSRSMKGEGWLLERGTVFVGRAAGGRGSRAYVQVIGYLDNRNNSFVRIGGDLQGVDGAGGLQGERKKIGSRWLKVLRQIGDRAYQTANTWISRNGSGTNITLPPNAQIGISNGGNSRDIEYVYVKPGSFGYFLVNDLPADATVETASLPHSDSTDLNVGAQANGNYISDEQVVNLMSEGDAEKIKQNLPRIRPEYREAVLNILKSKQPN
jgi:hypothetical protein